MIPISILEKTILVSMYKEQNGRGKPVKSKIFGKEGANIFYKLKKSP